MPPVQGIQSQLPEAGQLEHRVVAELWAAQARHSEILQQDAVRRDEGSRDIMTHEAVLAYIYHMYNVHPIYYMLHIMVVTMYLKI